MILLRVSQVPKFTLNISESLWYDVVNSAQISRCVIFGPIPRRLFKCTFHPEESLLFV